MQKRMRDHIRSNVVGYVALFFAMSGGAAWATHPGGANTISSGDIINEEVRTEDIRNANVQTPDIQSDAVTSGKVADQTLTKADLGLNSVGSFELDGGAFRSEDIKAQYTGFAKAYGIPPNAIQTDEISNGTITPADLADEAKGPVAFHTSDDETGTICDSGCTEGSLTVSAGFYAIFGKITAAQDDGGEDTLLANCWLADGGTTLDEAVMWVENEDIFAPAATMSMQAIRLFTAGSGTVSLNCEDAGAGDVNGYELQLIAIKLGSFVSR